MLIPRRFPGTTVPLTPAQSRLWFLDQAGYSGTTYLEWISTRYRGLLDPLRLERAMRALIARHEALRTTVEVSADGPVQVVADPPTGRVLEIVDVSDQADAQGEARRMTEAFAARPLRLDRAPLHRALLLRIAPDDHVFVWCLHHIVCDRASFRVLEEELLALYRGEDLGRSPVQFPDYAVWLAEQGAKPRSVEYWRKRLEGAPAVQSLPSDRARPAAPSSRGARSSVRLPAALSKTLLDVARRERCTPFVLFLSAMMAVLSRHSAERDVVVGTPVSDRDVPSLERSVGFYVNTLPIRADLTGDPTLRDLLRQVRATTFDALEHRTVPFEEIVRAAGVTRDPARNPLFQTMLVLESAVPAIAAGSLTSEAWPVSAATARMDLTLVVDLGERIELFCDYSTDSFTSTQIARFRDHLVRLLEALARDPDQRVSAVPLLDAAERTALLGGGPYPTRLAGAPAVTTPAGAPVVKPRADAIRRASRHEPVQELFDRIAAEHPEAPAVITADETLTYGELGRRAATVAERIRGASLVGIVLPTGIEAIVAVLGVLKAGAAYLPLSPSDPPDRTAALLRAAGADQVLTDRFVLTPAETGPMRPDDLAYVIFTSGSTGRPKGVMVGHHALAQFTESFREVHGFGPGQRILMLPPLTFDASVGDLFPALTSGAALVLHPEPARFDAAELVSFCARHGVTAVDAPAALWRSWTHDLASGAVHVPEDWPVTTMMVGGERVPTAALRSWARATGGRITFFNHYGPTEATVCATTHVTVGGDGSDDCDGPHLPIGRPLPNVQAYVLDQWGGLAVPGAPGELYLGGDCLAHGYVGEPGLTAEAFRPNPFHGGRMYRTGDLVRQRADGTLEFLGRADRQVKIRGHRIEPAEVEFAVTAHPAVRDAAVVAAGDRMIAYAVTETPAAELRRFMRARLPRHLVPDQIVIVDRVPRSAHGKIDSTALPTATSAAGAAAPPEGPIETALAAIWSSVLDVPEVGRTDNFFELGGSSLLATRLLAAIERDLGRTVPLGVLLQTETLADLAHALTEPATTGTRASGIDLWADRLPADLVPTVPRSSPMRTVLVTGATGFLGAHLVAELLATTDATVVCLVRATSPDRARDRVASNMRAYGLDGDVQRVVGLPGDLARPHLGLPEEVWQDLVGRCDVVCHNGGLVDFTEPYERLWPANVGGTVEVLRLVAAGGAALHAVSTLGVYLGASQRGRLVTESDAPGEPEELPGAYEQTKWVADRLCREAREAGLAVSVHRPARIGGHSVTGRGNPDDYFNRLLTTFVQTGCVPDLHFTEDLAPVDHVAAGIVTLLREPPGRDFHYFNPATISYPELAGVLAEDGYDVQLVPWARWRDELRGRLAAGAPLALAPFATALPERAPAFPRPVFDCVATERAVGASPTPARALVGRHLEFLASIGRIRPGALQRATG